MGRGAANAAALDGAIMSRQATTTKPVPYWEPAGQRSMAARAAGYGFTGVWLLYLIAALAALAITASALYGGAGASTLWIFVSAASGLLIVNGRVAVAAVLASGAC